jgi:hypothetical protein
VHGAASEAGARPDGRTNGINVAEECRDNEEASIFVLGGKLITKSLSVVGPQAELELQKGDSGAETVEQRAQTAEIGEVNVRVQAVAARRAIRLRDDAPGFVVPQRARADAERPGDLNRLVAPQAVAPPFPPIVVFNDTRPSARCKPSRKSFKCDANVGASGFPKRRAFAARNLGSCFNVVI